jgi:uncharacterized protein (DUF2267 family)
MNQDLDVFDTTLQKTYLWLKQIQEEMHWDDRHKAYLAMRAVLHALRDRLTVDEGAHLSAQLPMLVRGIYYEGWHPASSPNRVRHVREFLDSVAERYPGPEGQIEAERMTRAVFRVMERNVTAGELDEVKQSLPKEVQTMLAA